MPLAALFSFLIHVYLYFIEVYYGERPMTWGTATITMMLMYQVGEIVYSVIVSGVMFSVANKYSAQVRERSEAWAALQKKLAEDAVNAYIFNPAQVAVARKGLKGLWASSPIFANDIAAVSWQ